MGLRWLWLRAAHLRGAKSRAPQDALTIQSYLLLSWHRRDCSLGLNSVNYFNDHLRQPSDYLSPGLSHLGRGGRRISYELLREPDFQH